MKVEIITNPSTDIFLDLVRTSYEQLLASPFVKANVAKKFYNARVRRRRICFSQAEKWRGSFPYQIQRRILSKRRYLAFSTNNEPQTMNSLPASNLFFDG